MAVVADDPGESLGIGPDEIQNLKQLHDASRPTEVGRNASHARKTLWGLCGKSGSKGCEDSFHDKTDGGKRLASKKRRILDVRIENHPGG